MRTQAHILIVASLLLPLIFFTEAVGQTTARQEARRLIEQAAAHEKAKEYDQAIKSMNQAITLDPENDHYFAYASHLERLAGRYAEGVAHAIRAIELNPKVAWYFASVVLNAHKAGDYERVREYSQKYFALAPKTEGNHAFVSKAYSEVSERNYRIIWTLDPLDGFKKDGGYEIPVPTLDVPYQSGRFEVIGAKSHRVFRRDGNDLVFVVPEANKPFMLLAEIAFRPHCYLPTLQKTETGGLPDDVLPYLGKSEGIDPDNETVARVARKLKGTTTVESVRNILVWMKANLRYDLERVKTAEDVITKGHGECGGWSLAFVGLCRSIGIPAREVWGMTRLPDAEKSLPPGHLKGHAWAEFYVRGCGWIPVEPQIPSQLGIVRPYYIRMHHYDVRTFTWDHSNPRPFVNMFYMGGDTPRYKVTK